MKKYSEIKLTDEEKKILEWFKWQGYTHVGRTIHDGFVEVIDEVNDILCNLKPMRKPFEFINSDERYEIEKLLNPPHEPKTVCELEDGDAFWCVNPRGFIDKSRWVNIDFDAELRSQGNVFLTEEEAEFEAKRREVVTKVRKYARPFRKIKANFYPYYGYEKDVIDFYFTNYHKSAMDYFSSIEEIKKAIAEVGEEDFKKYYLGVVE